MTTTELNRLNIIKREIEELKDKYSEIRSKAIGTSHRYDIIHSQRQSNEAIFSRYYPMMERIEDQIDEKIRECIKEAIMLERYIMTIPDSLTRLIFSLRFIDGLSWDEVAQHIGGGQTMKSVSNICYRYIEKLNSL